MVIIDKTKNKFKIIDFACPFDSRAEETEKDKTKGYNNLERELKKTYASEGNLCSSRCIRNNTKEIKAVVEGYRD